MASVMVMCAHSDDQVIAPGGTLAKYASEGWDVHIVVFSFGELSHPHLRPEVISKKRVEESQEANKVIGGETTQFLGLKEGKFREEMEEKGLQKKIVEKIQDINPEKIFTHSFDDTHHDHRKVFEIVEECVENSGVDPELYVFDTWTLFDTKKKEYPKLVVDVSDYFKKKVEALHCFKSQIKPLTHTQFNNLLYISIYAKAFFEGFKNGFRFAETFYRVS